MAVNNKKQFYSQWLAGLLGNRIRIWDKLSDLLNDNYNGNVTVRYRQTGSPFCRPYTPKKDVEKVITEFTKQGAKKEYFTFNESPPDDLLLIQGEVYRQYIPGSIPPYLHYSQLVFPMRESLRLGGKHVNGILAVNILKYYLDENSYNDLQDIWDLYPSSVIEFSCYNKNLGIYPRRNTIIWEVRDY